ncbi:META domain-containing protein [Parasphingopyxis lamellibrachiae]|uniref:META domain-containing protein n=1 Tax=Parasphingopyxis lamellibrachiae TaxID=680125 RepID=A0A3D9FEM7_9SPHN|nr:META domain-containing protein [Parasphingopyxis lamellibrachiae]RED16285.1 META domain-containing protein [Parasphingopyxis lamellibrachiae]
MKQLSAALALLAIACATPAKADHHGAETETETAADPWTGFRGLGTEPFWTLRITDERLSFEHFDVLTAQAARPESQYSGGATVFSSRSENEGQRDFIVLIEDRLCGDGMSDTPYPKSVRVFVDGYAFAGCGGDPQDVLRGEDWIVTELMGQTVSESAGLSFAFDGSGGMSGNGGCNRFTATYTLDEGLSIGPVASTRRACTNPEASRLERQLFAALGTVISLQVDDDGSLTLYSETDPVLTARR